MSVVLTKPEIKRLKAAAHHLKPVLMIGDAGVTDGVIKEAEQAIAHHELIKVKLPAIEKSAREAVADDLCERLGASLVQRIGRTATLYREADHD